MKKILSRLCIVLVVFFFSGLHLAVPVHATSTIYVNSTTGNDTTGTGSEGSPYKTFHKGYTEAAADDIIDLTGTFTWTDADETGDASTTGYTIAKNLTIRGQGAGQTIVQSASSDNTADRRIFTTALGTTVTFDKLTVRYGRQSSSSYGGGGILVYGTATIQDSDISYNRASNGSGGGISVRGQATVRNSTIHHNVAHYKGGGLNRSYYSGTNGTPSSSDTLDIINCTITNNQVTQTVAYLEGGGVFYRRGEGSITNSTIAYNQVVNGGSSRSTHGVGTGYEAGSIKLKNNIIANNVLGSAGGDIGHRQNGSGSYVDNGGNIIGRRGYYSDGYTAAATSWMDATAYNIAVDGTYVLQDGGSTSGTLNLDSTLATNSNPNYTQTLAITDAASIAINNGLSGSNGTVAVPTLDQRGATRVSTLDIGPFEYAGSFDSTNPTIDTVLPADNATGVALDANLTITFDEVVDAETGFISLYISGGTLVEKFDVTSDISGSGTTTITINPTADLTPETDYYLKIDATAFDDPSGNSFTGITDTTTWNFTSADTTNPTATTLLPADNSTAVYINSNLKLTFTEAVDVETGTIVIYKASDNSVFETIDVTTSQVTGTGTNAITINPTSSLAPETSYYIQIDATAFDDTAGNSFAGISDNATWNFTTVDSDDTKSVEADDDSTYSRDNSVTLDISGTDTMSEITEMMISEDPNFTGASWEAYSAQKVLELSSGDGIKTIYIKYRDSNGNESETFIDQITVDTVMTLGVSEVAAKQFGSGTINITTTKTKPTFSGTAEAGSTIVITIQSDPITTTLTVGDDGVWSWTPDVALPFGDHTVTIVGTDLAGNTSTTSFGLTIAAEEVISSDTLPVSGLPMIFWGILLEIGLLGALFVSLKLAPRKV